MDTTSFTDVLRAHTLTHAGADMSLTFDETINRKWQENVELYLKAKWQLLISGQLGIY